MYQKFVTIYIPTSLIYRILPTFSHRVEEGRIKNGSLN